MTVKCKDIKLQPWIGNWYEYREKNSYNTNFIFKNLETDSVDELLQLHYLFGQDLVKLLTENLKTGVQLFKVSVEQMKYLEFLNVYKGYYASVVVPGQEFSGLTMLVDYSLANTLKNRIAGGDVSYIKNNKKFSDIEEVVVSFCADQIIKLYEKKWLNSFALDLTQKSIYSPKIKIEDRINKTDDVMVFSINLSLGDQYPVEVAFLFNGNDLEKLAEKYFKNIKQKKKKSTVKLQPISVSNIVVPVTVNIGTATLSMTDVLNLHVGDVLQLNEKIGDNVLIKIGDKSEFIGKLGNKNNRFAVKIIESKGFALGEDVTDQEVALKELAAPEDEPRLDTEDEFTETDNELNDDLTEAEENNDFFEENEKIKLTTEPEDDLVLSELMADVSDDEDEEDEEFTWDIDDL